MVTTVGEEVLALQQRARAHRGILREILSGRLARPDRLASGSELTTQLGMNRTAVREALAILAHEGFIVQVPQRGFWVVPVTDEDIRDLMGLRLASELAVVDAVGGAPTSLAGAETALERMRAHAESDQDNSAGLEAFAEWDNRFHVALAQGARHSTAARYIDTWRDFLRLYRLQSGHAHPPPEERMEIVSEHEQMLEALRQGDGELARHTTRSHFENTLSRVGLGVSSRRDELVSVIEDVRAELAVVQEAYPVQGLG